MNHIERARELCRKIPELKKLQDEKHKLDQYAAYREKLKNVAAVLAGLADIAGELRKRGAEVTGFKASVHGMRSETRRVTAAFGGDKSSIIAPLTIPTFWQPLEGMPKKIRAVLEKEWEKYVDSKIPSSQTDILETLSKVQGFAPQAVLVRRICSDMHSLGERLPQVDDFQRLDALADQVKQAWRDLHGEGLPPMVLEFLKKAHTSGFSLLHLDNEVLDWLKRQNLLGQYTIRGR